jgi:hypothetical protein
MSQDAAWKDYEPIFIYGRQFYFFMALLVDALLLLVANENNRGDRRSGGLETWDRHLRAFALVPVPLLRTSAINEKKAAEAAFFLCNPDAYLVLRRRAIAASWAMAVASSDWAFA